MTKIKSHWASNLKGQVLIIAIIFMAVILIISASMLSKVASYLRFTSNSVQGEQAIELAEAGVDKAVWQLNQTAGSYTGETNTALGTTGTFTVTITNKTSSLKTITATGYIPNSTNPKEKRTIKVDAQIDSQIVNFHYAVQVGTGGVTMMQNTTINGSVFSNSTGQSITGYNGSTITGDAYAVGTISAPNPFVQGTKHPNQSTPSQMPSVDNSSWIAQAEAGGTVNCTPTCSLADGSHFGPKEYQGNVLVDNHAIITMTGPVHITGSLTVQNGGTINLASVFGSNGTVLIVDQPVTVVNNGAFNPTNNTPKGYILVVTNSTSNTAMHIYNNGANAIFYALSGGATMENNSAVTALVAQSLLMNNNATLTYDSGLASADFTSGPGGSWQVKKGTYKQVSSP